VEIGWKRLSDIFSSTCKLVLYKEKSTQKVIKNELSIASSDFLLSLNAIRNISQFFNKVFEPNFDRY